MNDYDAFKKGGIPFAHTNMNSLHLPKIDKVCYIVKVLNASTVGISETKQGKTILSSRLEADGF